MIVAGTGHRPNKLSGYSEEAFDKLVTIAKNWLSPRKDQIQKVISGMALGWDMALATASSLLEIPCIDAVPFKGQELRWPPQSQDFYRSLLLKAFQVVYVSPGGYSAQKMQTRNEWMVDNSTILLALWNGDTFGGTYNCVKYAKGKRREIVNLWDKYKEIE